jgi:hypothetical protein
VLHLAKWSYVKDIIFGTLQKKCQFKNETYNIKGLKKWVLQMKVINN